MSAVTARKPGVAWLIGDPVSHSLSPLIHNAAFRAMGLPHVYCALRLKKSMVLPFLRLVEWTGAIGLNVTVPHKESVLPELDWMSPDVKACGASNCIRVRSGRLEGFNTDGSGFLRALREEANFTCRDKRVVLLGAGGAGRGVAHAVADAAPAELVVLNRRMRRARTLAGKLRKTCRTGLVRAGQLTGKHLREAVAGADLIIQATSVGLDGRSQIQIPWSGVPRKALVTDLIYRPIETPFLRSARKMGLKTLGGWAMFHCQAAESFEIWTGRKPPVEIMKRELLRALRGRGV